MRWTDVPVWLQVTLYFYGSLILVTFYRFYKNDPLDSTFLIGYVLLIPLFFIIVDMVALGISRLFDKYETAVDYVPHFFWWKKSYDQSTKPPRCYINGACL